MTLTERKAQVKSYLGKTVKIGIDRPIGYVHKKEKYSLTYPINYGYIPGVLGGDGEELDVYLLGVNEPVTEYTAKIIGIIHRQNDVEDKLVAAPEGRLYTALEIADAVYFQEQYYVTRVEALFEKSCGTVPFTVINGRVHYLIIRSRLNGDCGFPKGHIEAGESDTDTALRETLEETSVKAELLDGFKQEITYIMPNGKIKTVVYFLAEYHNQTPTHNEGFEHNDYYSLPYKEAYDTLTHSNVKEVLKKADAFLKSMGE